MPGRKKTFKKPKTRQGGNFLLDKVVNTFLDSFQRRFDHEKRLEEKLKKADPTVSIVLGKDLKPGCRYKFLDSSVYPDAFTLKSIRKLAEQNIKNAGGEEYDLTNEGWWIQNYPIGGNDKFIELQCGVPSVKSRRSTRKASRTTLGL